MGGDYNLWHGGIHSPAMREDVEKVLRSAFKVDGQPVSMYAQYLRRKYPALYKEVRERGTQR